MPEGAGSVRSRWVAAEGGHTGLGTGDACLVTALNGPARPLTFRPEWSLGPGHAQAQRTASGEGAPETGLHWGFQPMGLISPLG